MTGFSVVGRIDLFFVWESELTCFWAWTGINLVLCWDENDLALGLGSQWICFLWGIEFDLIPVCGLELIWF